MEVWISFGFSPQGEIGVSSLGRIRLSPSRLNPDGKITLGTPDPRGYMIATLFAGKIKKCIQVHRLIAMLFVENPQALPQVNHLDGVKGNNRADNLEWCTASRNQLHAISLGLRKASPWTPENIELAARGERHGNSRLTDEDVLQIRKLSAEGMTNKDIAALYGLNRQTPWLICTRKRWTHM